MPAAWHENRDVGEMGKGGKGVGECDGDWRDREQTQAQTNISRQRNHVTTGRRTKQVKISVISRFRDVL